MHFDPLFSTQRPPAPTSKQIVGHEQVIETELSSIEPRIDNPNSALMFGFWMSVFSIIFLILLELLKLGRIIARGRDNLPQSQVPCRNCKYFARKNQYLKCAVRPDLVLTKQALDCSDYCSRDETDLTANARFSTKTVGETDR